MVEESDFSDTAYSSAYVSDTVGNTTVYHGRYLLFITGDTVSSGVVGNFLLWERWHGIPYRYRGGGGGGVHLNEWSFIKGKNAGSNIGVYL